jgi:uncharacterized membrane protein HdeD (DUF308 family)
MLLEAIRQKHRRTWWSFVIRGVLALTVGVLVVVLPLDSLAALALIVAVWAIVGGITEIAYALRISSAFAQWWALLIAGLISTAFGVAALYYYPGPSLAFMAIGLGLWLLTSGVLAIYSSLHMKRAGLPWAWTCTWGVLAVLAGIIAFTNMLVTLAAVLLLLAVYAFVSGTALLGAAWRIRTLPARLPAVLQATAVAPNDPAKS